MKKLATLPIVSDTPFAELYKYGDQPISMVNYGQPDTSTGVAIFKAAIISILEFFNADWTAKQQIDSATIFFDECYWFTLAELKHFARKAKAMKLGDGKLYGAFTPATLMQWVAEYSSEAFRERTPYFAHKASQIEWQEPENPVSDERIKEAVADMVATLTKDDKEEIARKEAYMKLRQEQQAKHDKLVKEAIVNMKDKKNKKHITDQVPDTHDTGIPGE